MSSSDGEPLLGRPAVNADAAQAWARRHNAADVFVTAIIPALWKAGLKTGVRPEVLVAQSAHETGFGRFGGVLTADWHNTAGIKTAQGGSNYDPDAHQRFEDWWHGAECHANHLRWPYAGLDPVGVTAPRSARTATAAWAGTVTTVEGLAGRWAPSSSYHVKILTYVEELTPMRYGFVLHHNGPPARCIHDHTRCAQFWSGVKRYHVHTKGWSDIAYSFGICPHGERYVGRGWDKSQWANGADRVGPDDGGDAHWYTILAFVGGGAFGGFDTGHPEEHVTPMMEGAIRELVAEGQHALKAGKRVLPHNQFKPKACPGPTLTMLARRMDGGTVLNPNTEEEDDMVRLIELAYMEAGVNDPAGVSRWAFDILRKGTLDERLGGVNYVRSQLGLGTL